MIRWESLQYRIRTKVNDHCGTLCWNDIKRYCAFVEMAKKARLVTFYKFGFEFYHQFKFDGS